MYIDRYCVCCVCFCVRRKKEDCQTTKASRQYVGTFVVTLLLSIRLVLCCREQTYHTDLSHVGSSSSRMNHQWGWLSANRQQLPPQFRRRESSPCANFPSRWQKNQSVCAALFISTLVSEKDTDQLLPQIFLVLVWQNIHAHTHTPPLLIGWLESVRPRQGRERGKKESVTSVGGDRVRTTRMTLLIVVRFPIANQPLSL